MSSKKTNRNSLSKKTIEEFAGDCICSIYGTPFSNKEITRELTKLLLFVMEDIENEFTYKLIKYLILKKEKVFKVYVNSKENPLIDKWLIEISLVERRKRRKNDFN